MIKLSGFQSFAVPAVLSLAAVAPAPAQEVSELSAMRSEALDLTNAARAEAELPPLSASDILDQAAQDHAADMLERDFYDHVTPEGTTPFDRFLAAGGNSWAISGENIATCEGCPVPPDSERVDAFHDGWMQSPEHRENILSEGFDSFGFGIAGEGRTIFAVQTFSGPGADRTEEGEAGLDPDAARDVALSEINAARGAADLGPLEHSDALDTLAGRVLERLAEDHEALPENVFELLPESEAGYTSLALQTASAGGSGVTVDREDIVTIISDWAAATEPGQVLGGTQASQVGFAAEAGGDGRLSAVAVFGGREVASRKATAAQHKA